MSRIRTGYTNQNHIRFNRIVVFTDPVPLDSADNLTGRDGFTDFAQNCVLSVVHALDDLHAYTIIRRNGRWELSMHFCLHVREDDVNLWRLFYTHKRP